jgi:hypothetical protein
MQSVTQMIKCPFLPSELDLTTNGFRPITLVKRVTENRPPVDYLFVSHTAVNIPDIARKVAEVIKSSADTPHHIWMEGIVPCALKSTLEAALSETFKTGITTNECDVHIPFAQLLVVALRAHFTTKLPDLTFHLPDIDETHASFGLIQSSFRSIAEWSHLLELPCAGVKPALVLQAAKNSIEFGYDALAERNHLFLEARDAILCDQQQRPLGKHLQIMGTAHYRIAEERVHSDDRVCIMPASLEELKVLPVADRETAWYEPRARFYLLQERSGMELSETALKAAFIGLTLTSTIHSLLCPPAQMEDEHRCFQYYYTANIIAHKVLSSLSEHDQEKIFAAHFNISIRNLLTPLGERGQRIWRDFLGQWVSVNLGVPYGEARVRLLLSKFR